ncbi:MAG: glycosyltransferase family 4 protein [Bacteroidota bacterium]
MMKILYVIRSIAYGGGAERLMFDIYNEIKKIKNVEVKLLILENSEYYTRLNFPNSDFFEKQLINDSDVIHSNSYINLKILRKNEINIEQYKNLVDSFKPDIIHSHMYRAELFSREYLSSTACYFTHVHDNMIQFNNLTWNSIFSRGKITNFYEKLRLVKKYKKVNNYFISISKDTFSFIQKSINPPTTNNLLLNNAINYSNFYTSENKIIDPNKKIKLVSIGSLVKKKNHQFLIEVAKHLKAKNISFEINILGEGVERENLTSLINEFNLNEYVFLRGNVIKVNEYLGKADFFLHPSSYEPFGLVILEAMASGLPVICLNGKGNVGLNVEGKTGFMIDPPDAKKFADKILFLKNNPDEYSKISEFCVNFAKDYDIEIYCKKLVDIYQNAINKKLGIN